MVQRVSWFDLVASFAAARTDADVRSGCQWAAASQLKSEWIVLSGRNAQLAAENGRLSLGWSEALGPAPSPTPSLPY